MKRYAMVGLLLVACGDDGANQMKMVDAAVGVDAPKQVDAPVDAPPVATAGLIEITQGTDEGAAESGVDVQFSNVLFGPVAGTDGPCTLYSVAEPPSYSAGTITITGTTQTITMTPSGVGPEVEYEEAATIPNPVYTAGASITVTAAGGADVPAFNATVVAPATLEGYTPPTTISRSGYTATWTAGSGPGIWVIFAAFDSTTLDGVAGICRVDDTGSFTVPSTTWAMTPATADLGFVGVGRISPTMVNAGGTMVIVQAVSFVTSGELTFTN